MVLVFMRTIFTVRTDVGSTSILVTAFRCLFQFINFTIVTLARIVLTFRTLCDHFMLI